MYDTVTMTVANNGQEILIFWCGNSLSKYEALQKKQPLAMHTDLCLFLKVFKNAF